MAVPSVITDLNVSAGSNSPAGTDPIGSTLDDYLRAVQSIVRREQAQGTSIASSATTNIAGNTDGNYIHITGTTTITSFGTIAAGISRTVVFDGILTLTHNATSLVLPSAANITTAAGDVAEFISEGSGNWRCVKYMPASGLPIVVTPTVPPPRSYLAGLQMASNTGSSTTISIAAGEATDSTNVATIRLASSIGKTTSNWAVGSGNGGLDSGTIANNSTYHFYVIRRPDTGVTDLIYSLSASSPALPTNYTQYRRAFSWRTNGSAQWVGGFQDGDYFRLLTSVLDVNATAPGTSAISLTLGNIPTGINVFAEFNYSAFDTAGVQGVYFSDLSASDQVPSIAGAAPMISSALSVSTSNSAGYGTQRIRTNTSAQIRARFLAGGAGVTYQIATTGWNDSRGRNS